METRSLSVVIIIKHLEYRGTSYHDVHFNNHRRSLIINNFQFYLEFIKFDYELSYESIINDKI